MYDPPAYLWAITIAGIAAIPAATCAVLYGGAVRAGLGRRRAALLAVGATAVLGGWFIASAVIAGHGWYHRPLGQGLPWLPIAVAGFFGSLLGLRRIPVVARALAAPRMAGRLELPHTFRAVEGVAFLLAMTAGHLPALLALPAGLGDIAAGLAAPLVARRLAQGPGRRAALWFNAFGMTDLVVALTLGALTAYQLLHVTPSGAPISELPLALIPTAGVPLLFALHITSVRALTGSPRTPPPATVQRSRLPRSPSKPLVLVALLTASFAINLDTTLVNVALPTLTRELGATTAQLQWVVDAYNLVFAALLLTSGSLSDRFGRKGMLMAGLLVFGLASFAGGYATAPAGLIAARAVMGLGAAMTFPATLSLLTGVFTSRKERALAIGLWGATAGMAIALGPIVGGFLLERYSWSSIFYTLGPVSLAVAALVAWFVPSSQNAVRRRLDFPGLVLSGGFMGLLVYTIIEAPGRGWGSAASLLGFAGAAALLIGFIAGERRTGQPMLDVRLFTDMRFSAASVSVTISFFTLSGFIFLMTQYFQFVRAYSPLSAGVHLLPVAVSVAVGSAAGTRLAVRLGTKAIVAAGLALQAIFYFWVASGLTPTFSYGIIAIQMVVYGLGLGLTSAPATESIMGAVPAGQAGVGSAVNDSTRLLGGTLGVAVIGSVYASLYSARLTGSLPAALPHALARLVHQSVGAAFGVSGQLAAHGQRAVAAAVHLTATSAFDHGVSVGCLVAGAVAVAGALLAAAFLPARPPQLPGPELELAVLAVPASDGKDLVR